MPRQDPVRVPIDEIRRTLEDLDRQHTQNRARGSQGTSQCTVPNSLASQRAVHRPQGPVRVHFDDATLQALLEPRRERVSVPHEEILRMLDHLDRQRAEDRVRQRARESERIHRPTTPSPEGPREQEALPTPPVTQPGRPPKRRRSMGETLPTPPNTQPNHAPKPNGSPKRRRRSMEETLPTPPNTQPNRAPTRPQPMRETVQLQRESINSILQYREFCFRDKEEASATRSWCKEVPLARQVEASKSFSECVINQLLPIVGPVGSSNCGSNSTEISLPVLGNQPIQRSS